MKFVRPLLISLLALAISPVFAQEATIRKSLSERLPNLPKIDEISKTPMNGLYEVRMGSDIMYSDADGNFLVQGNLIDVKQRRNLTEERVEKLSAIAFDQLPLKCAATANASWWCLPTPTAATASALRKTCKNSTT
jgi:thiol:disulfide interchange protein DsbC